MIWPTFSSSTSNAATICSFDFLLLKYLVRACPQVSHTDHTDVHHVRAIQNVADEVNQDFDVVALFRIA